MGVVLAVLGAQALHADAAEASAPNLLSAMNPSFERGLEGWDFNASPSSTTAWSADGRSSLRLVGSVTNNDVSAFSSFVPVTAGRTYSARIRGKVQSALQEGTRLRIEWWNDTAQIGEVNGAAVAGATPTATASGVAPAGTTRARMRVFGRGTGTWDVYLDAAMIVEGALPSSFYAELPVNMLSAMNPSFDRATDGWSFSGTATPTTAWAYDGPMSMRHVASPTNNDGTAYSSFVPVAVGKAYSGRINVHIQSALQDGTRLRIQWWNDTSQLAVSVGAAVPGNAGTASVTGVAPSGATRARLRLTDIGTGTWDVYLDAAMIVEGGVPTHYYDALPVNMLSAMNPSFERAHDGWEFSHSAVSTQAWHYDNAGNSSIRHTGTVSNNNVNAFSSLVPVQAGKTYSGRITGKIMSALGPLEARIEWWNDSGSLGYGGVTYLNFGGGGGGTESTASVTAVAPAGATRARLRAFATGTGTWDAFLDGAMIVEGGVPSHYYEALPQNMLSAMNPSFERAQDGWEFSHTWTSSHAWQYDQAGSASMRLTGTVSNNDVSAFSSFVPVQAGKTYSGRISGNVQSYLGPMQARLEWWNANGWVGDGGVVYSNPAGPGAETASTTAIAPAGATRARLRAYAAGSGTWDVYLDGAMIVEGGAPSHYYDSALPVNMLSAMNPSFERAQDGWEFSHTWTSTQAWHYDTAGNSSMRLTGTVSNNDVSAFSSFVPVQAGKTYSGRISGNVQSYLGPMQARLEWWNDSGMVGDGGVVYSNLAGPGAETASVTAVAPTGATRARLRAYAVGTGTWDVYLDGAMIVEGGVPSHYYDDLPRNKLAPLNPSFEHGAEHWEFSHTRAATQAWHYDQAGSSSMRLTGTVSNNDVNAFSSFVPVAAGKTYSGRISGNVLSYLGPMQARIEWWSDSGSLGYGGVTYLNLAGPGAETASVTAVAPAGATRARLRAYAAGSGTWDVYLDGAMIVEGGVPSHYYPTSPYAEMETVFKLSTPATPEEVAQGAWNAGAELVGMAHTGPSPGGYVLEGEAVSTAVANYRSVYGSTPPVKEFTLKGSISTSALGGALAGRVAQRQEGDLGAGEVSDPPAREPAAEYPSSLAADDAYWETQSSDPRTPEATTAALPKFAFSPGYGKVWTYNVGGPKPRIFLMTMTWYPGSLDHFAHGFPLLDDAYEHNLQLHNGNVPNPSRKHPFCGNLDGYFWAKRSGFGYGHNFPDDAELYIDPQFANACKYRSFGFGLKYPRNIDERKKYEFIVSAAAGGTGSSSYLLYAARMNRICNVDVRGCTVPAASQPLIGVSRGVAGENICRRWRKGRQSRPC